jgi:hypothetical protein
MKPKFEVGERVLVCGSIRGKIVAVEIDERWEDRPHYSVWREDLPGLVPAFGLYKEADIRQLHPLEQLARVMVDG